MHVTRNIAWLHSGTQMNRTDSLRQGVSGCPVSATPGGLLIPCRLEAPQFLAGVDVLECIGFIVEGYLDDFSVAYQ